MPPIGSRASIGRLGACLPLIALVAVLLPGHAGAARIDAKERAAKKACMTGDPAKGVAILADLFIDTEDPTYIYNQGRCYEQNSRYEDAIGRFREYLRKATRATAEEKADAEKHIADCQALLGKKEEPARPAAPVPEPPRPAAALSPEPTRPAPAPVAAAPFPESPSAKLEPAASVGAVPSPSQAPGSPGSGLRVAGITTLAIGAAALVGGLAMNLKYNGMIDDLQGEYDPGTDDSSKTSKTLAIVGYAAGAACLAGGAVLYYLGWRAGRVSVAPVPVAGGAAAVLGGAF
ncbi:MAG: hypothetical protein JXP73_14235 [Deltaproteobacteria bacterium]|nr:hypothetical protein [Deltaproteobacteria bacterium]